MKRVFTIVAVAAVGLLGFLILSGGEEPYTVRMEMPNAGGLRNGSPVVVGGVTIGKVALDADFKKVDIKLEIDKQYQPIGKDATAAIIAQNVLGQKQVRIEVGDVSKPAPEGYLLPTPQVRASTDLDQLLSTLDADTRTRLAIVINEAGIGFDDRKLDFKTFLTDLRPALDAGGALLTQLTQDNQALGNLVETSDSYVASLAASKAELSRAIDVFGRTTETVAARRAELRETLRRAPATLVAARGFLSELRQTTGPLAATARLLQQTAPSVGTVLDRIGPLTAAAKPTLETALDNSVPSLIRLGNVSTRRAASLLPTVKNAANLAENDLPAVGAMLNKSVDNTLATVENWSRAIQFRDGLGHIFRGEASFSPQLYAGFIKNLGGSLIPTKSTTRQGGQRKAPAATAPAPAAAPPAQPARPQPITQQALDNLLDGVGKTQKDVQQLLDNLTKKPLLPGGQPLLGTRDDGQVALPLLDYLLGR